MPPERQSRPGENPGAAETLLGGAVETSLGEFGMVGDVPAERALLGCALLDGRHAGELLDALVDADWTDARHVAVAAGIRAVIAAGEIPDPVSVRSRMVEGGHVSALTADTSAGAYLVELEQAAPVPMSAWSYRRAVLVASWRRTTIRSAVQIVQAAEHASDAALVDLWQTAMVDIARARARIDAAPASVRLEVA